MGSDHELLARLLDPALLFPKARRPSALDVSDDGPDLLVPQLVLERPHVGCVARPGLGSETEFGHLEERSVGVLPGVPLFIVRGCRQLSIGAPLAPVRLPFEIHSVARGTVRQVNSLASGDLRSIMGIRLVTVASRDHG